MKRALSEQFKNLKMFELKFGKKVKEHNQEMTKTRLKRKLLEN